MTTLGFDKPLYVLPLTTGARSRRRCSDGTVH